MPETDQANVSPITSIQVNLRGIPAMKASNSVCECDETPIERMAALEVAGAACRECRLLLNAAGAAT